MSEKVWKEVNNPPPPLSLSLSLSLSLTHTHTHTHRPEDAESCFLLGFLYQLAADSTHKFQSDCPKPVQICNSKICEYSPFCKVFHNPMCTVLKFFNVLHRGDTCSRSDAILSRLNPVHTFAPIHTLSLWSLRS